jgi:plasmid maintenance system antidote protein VapI
MVLNECIESEEGLSQHRLSMSLKIPFVRINEICNEKRSITPDTAMRTGKGWDRHRALPFAMTAMWIHDNILRE